MFTFLFKMGLFINSYLVVISSLTQGHLTVGVRKEKTRDHPIMKAASSSGQWALIKFLHHKGADLIEDVLAQAIIRGEMEMVNWALEMKVPHLSSITISTLY